MSARIPEGETVSFVGELYHDTPIEIGDTGRVISASDNASHVQWKTGAMAGKITLLSNNDLVINRGPIGGTDDALDGPIVTMAVRDVYEKAGPTGLLSVLHVEGHLTFFEPLVQEAIDMIATNIRNDASFRSILSQLGREEGETLVSLAVSTLLKDAFGEL